MAGRHRDRRVRITLPVKLLLGALAVAWALGVVVGLALH